MYIQNPVEDGYFWEELEDILGLLLYSFYTAHCQLRQVGKKRDDNNSVHSPDSDLWELLYHAVARLITHPMELIICILS